MVNKGRRKRKSAILTDTPEKDAIEDEKKKSTKKAKFQRDKIKNKKKKSITRKVLQSSSDDDDYNCLICCEAYSESLPGENWVQCQVCK